MQPDNANNVIAATRGADARVAATVAGSLVHPPSPCMTPAMPLSFRKQVS
jgi:hypothetical protein